MKLKRKGNLRGLDIDYEITNPTSTEVDEFHHSLLEKGFLFMYSSSGKYEIPTKNVILHYIDRNLKLYDYAVLFSKQEERTKTKHEKSPLDEAYERSKTDSEFKERLMEYMKYNKYIYAFSKYISLHGPLKGEYLDRFRLAFKDIILPEEYTVDTLKKLDKDLFVLFLS